MHLSAAIAGVVAAALASVLASLAILSAVVCLRKLRNQALAAEQNRSELLAMLHWQREESAQQVAQLNRGLDALEQSRRALDDACDRPLPRSRRTQAIQLLRSGMSTETVASSLGLATRETRLIARVSRLLTLE